MTTEKTSERPAHAPTRGRHVPNAGSAEAAAVELASATPPDVVIVDPPRKGLEPALRAGLCAHPPTRLVYVSCGLESFLEDARALLATGRVTLGALEAWAFLPFTDHVEVLARFDAR